MVLSLNVVAEEAIKKALMALSIESGYPGGG
jgi:hypothetical protein